MKLVLNISPLPCVARFILASLALIVMLPSLSAEGVQQVAPTEDDSPVMLETNSPNFGNFAAFDGPETGRLYVTIGDVNEKIFVGLSLEYNEDGTPFPGSFSGQYQFRIRYDDGQPVPPVVHGPFVINNGNANLSEWADASFGNYNVTTTQNGQLMYEFQPSQTGNYFIEFSDVGFQDATDELVFIPFWDITVANGGTAIPGRVWSRNWAFRTPERAPTSPPECVWNREFNGTFYSYTADQFVSRIDFQGAGMQGLSFNVAFNSTGPGTSGNLTEDRKSVPGVNATLNSAEHQIFLEEPDPAIFTSDLADCGEIIIPQTFSCLSQDSFCLNIEVTKPGQVEIVLDFNQNGVLDPDSEDVTLLFEFTEDNLTGCVPWDGLRGDGTPIGVGDTIDLIFQYSQGIQHWSAYDVEYMRNGYCIETIRPICSNNFSSDLLFWDDTDIPDDPGTGAVKDGRTGCDCNTMCRNWDNFVLGSTDCDNFNDDETSGYGDKNTINTWWFANTTTVRSLNIPLILGFIAGPDTICAGDIAVYTASDEGTTGSTTYSWTGPNGFTGNTMAVDVTDPGEYCVEITDALGCSSTVCKTLTVLNPDGGSPTYEASLTACVGSQVDLIANGDITGLSFVWSPGILLNDSTIASPSFTFTEPVTFTVTITDADTNCSYTRTVEVGGRVETQADFSWQTGCDQGLTINFTDNSTEASTYLWDFGDPATTADSSTLPSPSYTYPAAGSYLVKLTTTSIDGCTSVIIREVSVELVSLVADFTASYNSCTPDEVEVQFTNTSINGANNTTVYDWTFSNGNGTSSDENPVITINGNQTFTATLTITTADGCTASTAQDITVNLGPPADQFPDIVLVCPGDSVQITPAGATGFTYVWSPNTGISDINSPQPTFFPASSTTYTVTVTAAGTDECEVVETVNVTVPPTIGLSVSGGGNFCTPTTPLSASTAVNTTIVWFNASGDSLFTGPVYTADLSGTDTYTAIATDASGCTETDMVTVSGGLVDITVPDTVAVCLGQEIMLSVTNDDLNDTLTYLWEPANLFAPGTNTSATPDYLEAIGTEDVTVTVTNQFGCTTQETVHVAVIDPDIMLSFTSEIDCNGGTVTFTNTSTAAFGYVWDFGDGSGPNFEANPVHTYANGGLYTVTLDIVYDVDCTEPFSMDVMVEEPQIFAGFTYDITTCSPDSAVIQFFDTSTNTLNNTVSWEWTFVTATPATSNEQNPSVTVFTEDPLVVTLTIGTANDCSNTISETLEIDLVDLSLTNTDTTICLGTSVTLNPDGDPTYTYSWTPTDGLDDPTAPSPVATPTVTTTYVATAFSTVGADTCFVTDSVVVTIPESIELELDQDPVVVSCGEDVTITATANVDVTVEWSSTLEGPLGNGPSITVNPFRTDTIIAIATDEFGCTASDSIIVIDNGIDFDVEPGFDITTCQGVDTTLTVVNTDLLDTLTFQWSPEEYIIGPADGSSVNIEVTEPGTVVFTAIVTNQHDCVDTVEFNVNVLEFEGEVADTVFACYNEATPLNPVGNPTYTFNWSPTDGLDLTNPANPVATLTENQTYYVTITDPSTTCSDQDSIVVIVQPDIDLQTAGGTQLCEVAPVDLTATTAVSTDIVWLLMGDTIGTGATITVLPPNEDGCFTYTAIATDPLTGCSQTSTEEVCLQVFTEELPSDTVFVCANEPTPINPGGDPELVYEWMPEDEFIDLTEPWNPVVTTDMPLTYVVTVTDTTFGCMVMDTINIELNPELNLMVTPDSTVLCASGDVTLTASSDFPAESIEWFLLPDNSPLGTGTSITFTPPAGTSEAYAVATSGEGCTEQDTAIILNYPLDVAITDTLIICEPVDEVELSVINNADDQDITVNWEPTGVLTALDELTVTVNPNVTNIFSATVTNQFGCTQTLTTTVTVIDLMADLTIAAEPDTVLVGESSTITVSGCVGCSYNWDPPAEDSPVIVVTPEEGENVYFVTVNLLGCEQDLMTSVFAIDGTCDVDHVYLPNAFTPNNDGSNDVLRLRSSFIDELSEVDFFIYNRWGEEMFRTTDPYQGWDGIYRGEQLPPDVYGFYLRVLCPNGEELVQKGNINLLR